jgi:hypothetical protein
MAALPSAYGASVLRHTLMHLDTPAFSAHPYRTGLRRGTPGTVLHARSAVRYPNQPRGEDSVYLRRLRSVMPVTIMDELSSHLFIRCYHGQNTWDYGHFTERLHYTWRDKVHYARATLLRRDLFSHPAFALTPDERRAFERFREDSRALGLS